MAHPLTDFHPLKSAIPKTLQDWGWNSKSGDVSPKIRDGISLTSFFFKNNLKAGADLGLCWAVFFNFLKTFRQVQTGFRKIFSHSSVLGRFQAILWLRFLAFYTLVFQAYLEAFLEA
jgi:hypothetical protein